MSSTRYLRTLRAVLALALTVLTALSACTAPLRVPPPGHRAKPVHDSSATVSPNEPAATEPAANHPNAGMSMPGTGQFVAPAATSAPKPAASPATGGGIQLAFNNADIAEVMASVLGEGLGLNYSIDPAVKGS